MQIAKHTTHRKFDHVSPLLKELHWLRVPKRITFRLAVLAYRCQHNTAPRYLTAQLQQASNVGYRQRLLSSSSAKLDVPRTEHVTIGGRAFSSTAAHEYDPPLPFYGSSRLVNEYRIRAKVTCGLDSLFFLVTTIIDSRVHERQNTGNL